VNPRFRSVQVDSSPKATGLQTIVAQLWRSRERIPEKSITFFTHENESAGMFDLLIQLRTVADSEEIRGECGSVDELGFLELSEISGSLEEAIGPVRPLAFEPLLIPKVWGGSRLLDQAARRLKVANFSSLVPGGEICRIGESWELSGIESQSSRLRQLSEAQSESHQLQTFPRLAAVPTPWTLRDLWNRFPIALAGRDYVEQQSVTGEFPWLIKFLDCKDWLSLQVHPTEIPVDAQPVGRPTNDSRRGHRAVSGKFEFWLVMDSPGEGEIIHGPLVEGQREQLAAAVEDGASERELLEAGLLGRSPLEAGHWVILPPGCVHSVRGVTLLEVQTPVDVTYRIDDYGRSDGNGLLRPLHPRLAAEAIRTGQALPEISSSSLLECDVDRMFNEPASRRITQKDAPFQLVCHKIGSEEVALPLRRMTAVCVLEGSVELSWSNGSEVYHSRDLRLLPVELGNVVVSSGQAPASILLIEPTDERALTTIPPHPR
jgi:mannose-6-phosphate isomerase